MATGNPLGKPGQRTPAREPPGGFSREAWPENPGQRTPQGILQGRLPREWRSEIRVRDSAPESRVRGSRSGIAGQRLESEIGARDWGQRSGSEIGVRDYGQRLGSEIAGQRLGSEIGGQRLGSGIAGPRSGSEIRVRDGLGIDLYDPSKHLGV